MSERPDITAGDPHASAGVPQRRSAAWRGLSLVLMAIAGVAALAAVFAFTSDDASLRLFGWRLRFRDEFRPLVVAGLAAAGAILFSDRFRSAAARGRRQPAWLAAWALLFAIVLVPLLGVAVKELARSLPDSYPVNDATVTSLYTARAAEGRLLVGPYSRFGWHHPGPLLFYLLTPAYVVTNHHEVSHKFTAVCLVLLVSATLFAVTRAFGGRPLLGAVAAVVCLLMWRLPELPISTWNPHVLVLPLMVAIVVAAAVLAGALWLVPLLAVAVTLVVQSHVGLAPAVAPLALAALIAVARAWGGQEGLRQRGVSSTVNATAWILALLWFLPLAEQAGHEPGNLSAILAFFREHPPAADRSIAFALGLVGRHVIGPFAPGFTLAVGNVVFEEPQPTGAIVVTLALIALLVVASVASLRAGRVFLAWLSALCCLVLVLAAWSVLRVVGDVVNHLVFWIVGPGTLAIATLAAVLVEQVSALRHTSIGSGRLAATRTARADIAFAVVVLIVLGALGARSLVTYQQREAEDTLGLQVYRDLRTFEQANGLDRPLLAGTPSMWAQVANLLLQHVKAGRPAAADDSVLDVVGEWFRRTGNEDGRFLLLRDIEFDALPNRDNVTVVSRQRGVVMVRTPLVEHK